MLPHGKSRTASAVAVLLMGIAIVGPLHAQVVTGRVVDASASQPVATAFVELLDAAGARMAGTLTDSVGRFLLGAGSAGEYRLRAERLGYESVMSPLLRLGADPVQYVFELNPRALVLPSVDAHSEDTRGCQRRPDGPAVVALWDAIRTALNITSWTGETGSIRFSMINHTREFDPSMRRVKREERTPAYTTASMPYGAADPAELARSGYHVQEGETGWLMGLDADVLLSESFMDSHCFRLVRPRDGGRVGLGFTPLRRDERTDVSGVLWVDPQTAALQYLEFAYEGLPDYIRRFGAKGEVHFEQLSTGAWIVTRWWIRSPLVGTRPRSRRYQLLGYREDGGTVTSADAIDTSLYRLRGRGAVEGVVVDSVSGRPIADALVFLSGTPFWATTDTTGRYRVEGVPAGGYAIGFTHPVLDELGVPLPVDSVTIRNGPALTHSFAAPSLAAILRALCPGEVEETTTGLLWGQVMDGESGEALPDVEVRASWRGPRPEGGAIVDRWRTARTGMDGRYFICWVPPETSFTLRVNSRRVENRVRTAQLPYAAVLRLDFD